jgi:subtilase family serine protease
VRLLRRPAMAITTGLIILLGMLAAVGVIATAAPGAVDAATSVSLTSSAAVEPQPGAVRLGALPSRSRLHLTVTLKTHDQAGMNALLNGLADKSSPYFHDFLTPAQIGADFGPTLGQVATVVAALRAAGLTPGAVTANRMAIPVTATAAQAEQAFGIAMIRYRLPGGRVAYANASAPKLAALAAPLVSGVLGLDDLATLHDSLQHLSATAAKAGPAGPSPTAPTAAAPEPCADATSAALKVGSYTTNQIALHYALTGLYALGDLAQGKHIALAELEPYLPTDISTYESCYGIHTKVNRVAVNGGAGTGAGQGEAALDIELTASLAPDSIIDVYEAPNTVGELYDVLNHFASTTTDKVLLDNWGLCEPDLTAQQRSSYETAIQQADAEGRTVVAAAGDTGSTGCYGDGTKNAGKTWVQSPSDSPYAVAVGGTKITSDAPLTSEVTWNESALGQPATGGGAGGGGVSDWCMPAYQYKTAIPGLVKSSSLVDKKACGATNKGGLLRQLPDISADGDSSTGYVGYLNGAWSAGWGGTSMSATVVGAMAAIIDASPFCSFYGAGNAGLLPQALYGLTAIDPTYIYRPSAGQEPEVLSDITSGNDDYTPSGYTGGLYGATKGYDMATGLGVPLVSGLNGNNAPSNYYPGLAAKMCWAMGTAVGKHPKLPKVTSVSPRNGKAGQQHTITVHGKNFMPIAGADQAKIIVNTKTFTAAILPATCHSTTVCTVTMPALSPRVVDIQIAAESFAYSTAVTADRYRYVGVPHISGLSSAHGKRGTKVTIHGNAFYGVSAVFFGRGKGTSLKVISSTELTVVVPAGSGKVAVTVVTAGGTSNARSFTY